MPFDLWMTYAAACALVLVIPGPTVLLVLSYALTRGRTVALATCAGVALGDLIAMSASLAGLGVLIATSATIFTIVKLAGAAWLIWLGIGMLKSTGGQSELPAVSAKKSARDAFFHTAAVTVFNPKSILFFVAFVPQFINREAALGPQFTVLIATFVGLGALNVLLYALLADRLRVRMLKPSGVTWLSRIGGSALIAMGFAAALSRRTA